MAKEQAFHANGSPVKGTSFLRGEFEQQPKYLMGSVQVWVWRRVAGGLEVLIQKRSLEKKSHPGMLDISAAGHIEAGDVPLESVVREFNEELGYIIDVDKLVFMFSIRKTNVPNLIATIYSYEVDNSFSPVFKDGEVDEIYWKSLDDFEKMTKNPAEFNLVPHGHGYYTVLIERLRLYENH